LGKKKFFRKKLMVSALTTAQNFLRIIISEATDITKKSKPSRACARRLPYGFRFTTAASLFFQKNFIYPTPDAEPCPIWDAKLEYKMRNLSKLDSAHP
jgi:hypothetical protein